MMIDADGLRRDLTERARRRVSMTLWDDYVLGRSETLRSRTCKAGEAAAAERKRWAKGRFAGQPGELSLCIADAAMSAQRDYGVAVRSAVRPFAIHWAGVAFDEFARTAWESVFEGTFGTQPRPSALHHLSREGRIRATVRAAAALERAGIGSAKDLRDAMSANGAKAQLEAKVTAVKGIGPALFAYLGMNAGILAMKLDAHVKAVLAPYLGLRPTDTAAAFEKALLSAGDLGMTPFEADQVIWYTQARSGGAPCG